MINLLLYIVLYLKIVTSNNDTLYSMSVSPTIYPYIVYKISCDFDDTITNKVWCFGGQENAAIWKSDVYSFDGNSFTSEISLPTSIGYDNHGNYVHIINGIAYLIDVQTSNIRTYDLIDGTYTEQYSVLPEYMGSSKRPRIDVDKINFKLYIINSCGTKNIYQFDILNKTWKLYNITTTGFHCDGGLSYYKDKIYIFAGDNLYSNTLEYITVNPSIDSSFIISSETGIPNTLTWKFRNTY